MPYKRLKPAQKLTTLPAKYTSNMLGWDLDWRSPVGMRLAAEVLLLAQDLGGWESLSRQRQILVERAAYLRIKTAEYEAADLQGKPTGMDAGTHSNRVNVLLGHLRTLGLDRRARTVETLHDVMYRTEPEPAAAAEVPGDDRREADATAATEEIIAEAPSTEAAA